MANIGTDVNSTSASVSHTLVAGSGNRIGIGVASLESSSGITAMSYGGNSMSFLISLFHPVATNNKIHMYIIKEADLPSDGVNTFAVTLGSSSGRFISFHMFDALDQSAAILTNSDTTPNDTSACDLDLTSTVADSLFFAATTNSIDGRTTTWSLANEIYDLGSGDTQCSAAYEIINATGLKVITATPSAGGRYVGLSALFEPVGGAATNDLLLMQSNSHGGF